MVDITSRCNFRCKHCYKHLNQASEDISPEALIYFLRTNDGFLQTKMITLTGGETLLYPCLEELLDELGKYKVRLNTNGYYLDKYVPLLTKYPNVDIAVSLDGYDEKSYETIRNSDSFNLITSNILKANQAGLKVHIHAVATTATIGQWKRFIDCGEKLGVSIMIRPMIYTGEERQKALALGYSQMKAWMDEVHKDGLECYTGGHDVLIEQSCGLVRGHLPGTLVIDQKGNMYPCPFLRYDRFFLGRIESFEEANFLHACTQVTNMLRDALSQVTCVECGYRNRFGDGTCLQSCCFSRKYCLRELVETGIITCQHLEEN